MDQVAYVMVHSDRDCQSLSSEFLSCPLAAAMIQY